MLDIDIGYEIATSSNTCQEDFGSDFNAGEAEIGLDSEESELFFGDTAEKFYDDVSYDTYLI